MPKNILKTRQYFFFFTVHTIEFTRGAILPDLPWQHILYTYKCSNLLLKTKWRRMPTSSEKQQQHMEGGINCSWSNSSALTCQKVRVVYGSTSCSVIRDNNTFAITSMQTVPSIFSLFSDLFCSFFSFFKSEAAIRWFTWLVKANVMAISCNEMKGLRTSSD